MVTRIDLLRRRIATRPFLLLLPILVLFVVATYVTPERQDDEAGYLELAHNLTDGHYASGRPDALLDADPSYPDLWFGPGLPLVLAGPVAAGVPLEILRLSGPIFLFLALLGFYALLRLTLDRGIALLGTWLLALYVPFYSVLTNLHSEPLAILFLVLALYGTARVCRGEGGRWIALAAGSFAGLALTRVAYGWVLALALGGVALAWALSRAETARRLTAIFAGALVLCVPWLAYTAAETGRLWQWSNSGSLSLYWMSSPHPGDQGDWRQANDVFTDPGLAAHRPVFVGLRGLPLPEQNEVLERAALKNIREHPLAYAENVTANVSRMLFDAPYSHTTQRLTAIFFALPNALLLGVFGVALAAALRARASLPPELAPFALVAVGGLGLHTLLAAYPRMLLPIVPLLAWFAAVALVSNLRLVDAHAHAPGPSAR